MPCRAGRCRNKYALCGGGVHNSFIVTAAVGLENAAGLSPRNIQSAEHLLTGFCVTIVACSDFAYPYRLVWEPG
jgi:hypothetical protein